MYAMINIHIPAYIYIYMYICMLTVHELMVLPWPRDGFGLVAERADSQEMTGMRTRSPDGHAHLRRLHVITFFPS